MNTIEHFSRAGILSAVVLAAFGLVATVATADTVNAIFNSAGDVPVTASGYTATGNTVNFTLNYAPATGTDLMVVNNNGLGFIEGTFDNLAQGQPVALSYGGVTYRFVANYYGGSGNDLVLVWASNRAFAWGNNDGGQLGDNTSKARQLPVPVTPTGVLAGKTVVAVAAGTYHSLVLCSDGSVAALGLNDNGQLGDNSTRVRLVPTAVNTASGISALFGKTVVAISAGSFRSLALCSDGTVAAWGDNIEGRLGDNGMSGDQSLVPVPVNRVSSVSALYGKTVAAISAGAFHSLALCSDGTVAAWRSNPWGQLGNNTTTPRSVPAAVNANSGSALYGKTVVAIAAGSGHSLALCSDGTVAAWGLNAENQLGDNTATDRHLPVAVNTNTGSALYGRTVVAIAAGRSHSMALCSDGTVAAWGYNHYGHLGDGTTDNRQIPVAVNTNAGVSALYGRTVVAIAAGMYYSLALCSDGTAAAWGYNYYGELGDNSTSTRYVPVNTSPFPATQRLTHITSGQEARHTLALVAAPPASAITLVGAQKLAVGVFQFSFTNTRGAFFGVLATTNSALPLSNWTSLTGLTEVSPGQFQFTDPQATNSPQRFYRVRSP